MNRPSLTLLTGLLPPPTVAAEPFLKGDAAAGKKLLDAKCVACHQRPAPGDGSGIFTRIDRKIQTPKALLRRIAACNALLNAGWFPEEEEHAAANLDRRYHKCE